MQHYAELEHKPLAPSRFVRLAFASPAYSWGDLVKIPLGFHYSFNHLWREIFYEANLSEQAPRIGVPVIFMPGRYNEVVTSDVAGRHFEALEAPRGKRLIWFENSGHWPHFEEPQKYRRVLTEMASAQAETNRASRLNSAK